MLRTTAQQLPRCQCRLISSTTQYTASTSSTPPPSPLSPGSYSIAQPATSSSPSRSTPTTRDPEPWSDPRYVARYRDPANHERSPVRPSYAGSQSKKRVLVTQSASAYGPDRAATLASKRELVTQSSARSQSDATTSSSSISRRRPSPSQARTEANEQSSDSPRARRLDMERMWSGGEFSPPLPAERYSTQHTSHALLFPGSASQYVGMGLFLQQYSGAREVWRETDEVMLGFEDWRRSLKLSEMEGDLGQIGKLLDKREPERKNDAPLRRIVFDGPQNELTRSMNAQPAILVTSIAFLRTLEQDIDAPVGRRATCFLGHSSGEFSAAVASGALSLADGIRLTRLHGLLTSAALTLPSISLSSSINAAPPTRAQMSALVLNPGRTHEEVCEVVEHVSKTATDGHEGQKGSVEIASYNSSSQVVLAGTREGILRASEELREQGIASRAADLPVSAPFHCSFMKPAAEGMQVALDSVRVRSPAAPIISGLDTTEITSPSSLIQNLVDQISLPVRWSDCISALPSHGVERLIFLGPGKALANLARRDAKSKGLEIVSVAMGDDLELVKGIWRRENARASAAA